ncbi:MAG: class I SAM-dependent methyltransferase [Deltaproteobacteria bacterium]|nr:MAG: class I SAM-dependent methyltransferase [Deltaproteobacteria bacterium]
MWYDSLLNKDRIPDALLRHGIRRLCTQRLRDERQPTVEQQMEQRHALVQALRESPLAIHTDEANEQHYELPSEFFHTVLGKHLKYSSCYWKPETPNLDAAEAEMLALTCERASLDNGQTILELGCGWGSLSLWMAEHYPESTVISMSNSSTQKAFIDARAQERGLTNLTVITEDINAFHVDTPFDRVVSVEMFEHVRNYEILFGKVHQWLKPGGRLFTHVFCHKDMPYTYEIVDESDWMAKYFFTGGTMPSIDLFLHFADGFRLNRQWIVNGMHYYHTCEAWLKNMDDARNQLMPLFKETYSPDQALKWWVYWRIFFMACAELFRYNDGNEWMVCHYQFEKLK